MSDFEFATTVEEVDQNVLDELLDKREGAVGGGSFRERKSSSYLKANFASLV